MSLSPTRLTAVQLLYSPTELICIIFKETDNISIVMQRELGFARKITNNTAKTKNSITTVRAALVITVITSLLLSSPVVGVVSVWADNFFGTSGLDTIVGTDNDDKIFGRAGNDNLRGEGGDDYIAGNAGNDEINDGLGSDKIRAGSGRDNIVLEGRK
jgi:Ca2+-binding RTX toxin-like protein